MVIITSDGKWSDKRRAHKVNVTEVPDGTIIEVEDKALFVYDKNSTPVLVLAGGQWTSARVVDALDWDRRAVEDPEKESE